jgi:hypothetical protein
LIQNTVTALLYSQNHPLIKARLLLLTTAIAITSGASLLYVPLSAEEMLPSLYIPANEITAPTTRTFVITAYYSPLVGQSSYLMGSYEADIKLNGNGTHGASGKKVFPGMIAAPKSYTFGQYIDIPNV